MKILTCFLIILLNKFTHQACTSNDGVSKAVGSKWTEKYGLSERECKCVDGTSGGAECKFTNCLTLSGKSQSVGSTWTENHPNSEAVRTCKCEITKLQNRPSRNCSWSHCFTRKGKAVSQGANWRHYYESKGAEKSCGCYLVRGKLVSRCQWRPYCIIKKMDTKTYYGINKKWQDMDAEMKCQCKYPNGDRKQSPRAFCAYNIGCADFIIPDKFYSLGTKMGPCICERKKLQHIDNRRSYHWNCLNNPPTCNRYNGHVLTVGMKYTEGSGPTERLCTCTKVPGFSKPYVICLYLKGCYSYLHDMKYGKGHDGFFPVGTVRDDGCLCVYEEKDKQAHKGKHHYWKCKR